MKILRKSLNIILIIGILFSNFIPFIDVYASNSYTVKVIKSDGSTEHLNTYSSYEEAKAAMNNHNSTEDQVAVIYNSSGQIINAKYAIVKFAPGNVIYLYPSATSPTKYTSIHTSYGSDAAFLDYDVNTNRVKIRISGYTGWANFGAAPNSIKVNPEHGRSSLRAQPTIDSEQLDLVEEGSILTYTNIENDLKGEPYKWYKVTYNGKTGYIAERTDDNEEWLIVLDEMLEIIPISLFKKNSIKINNMVEVYPEPSTSSTSIMKVYDGQVIPYSSKTTAGGYTWYQITYNGKTGWVPNKGSTTITETKYTLQTLYQAWQPTGNLLHYYEHQENHVVDVAYNNLAAYPSFMSGTNVYYSFDGNYFYNSLIDMLDDYKSSTYNKAINKNNPHYPYYMYLPTHSKTGYRAKDFDLYIKNLGYTRNRDYTIEYYTFNEQTGKLEPVPGVSREGISLLYGTGQYFVNAANTYGINSLMMFSTAINESAKGTSAIAFYTNNLFGLGAIDSNPVLGARKYSHVKDSIFDFAVFTGSSSSKYSNPFNIYYFGSHYGNKGSGMNVNYATDPYWGEKQARNSFNADKAYGFQDFQANTIGVTTKTNVNLYKKPDGQNIIYTLKNNYYDFSVQNIPLIVFDKVLGSDGKYWYKVYSDAALDENQNVNSDITYRMDMSYGYVRAEDLYVANNQPSINAQDIVIKQGESLNLLNGVTATDLEDGDLTSKIVVMGEVDTNTAGNYTITYTVEDNSRFQASKQITVTVLPSDAPHINASDKTVPQYTTFEPLSDVTATDHLDGDITANIKVITNEVDTSNLGTYKVVYEVTNSFGKTTRKEITVTVIPNEPPVIIANNKTITVGEAFNPLQGVTAVDKEDGVITNIEIESNNVDTSKPGVYEITYRVVDKANNVVTKKIQVIVENIKYIEKEGEFYFESMQYNKTTDRLEVAGYLAIKGMNNTASDNIKYDLIFKNNFDNTEIVKPLERWLEGQPNRNYSDGVYNYSATWFKGSVDLSDLEKGEYTLYVRARLNNYQANNLFRNVFGKDMVRKAVGADGTGYLFRNNNYLKEYPIELFVSKKGLISTTTPPHSSNMFNNYKSLNFDGKYLNIIGTSYNINADYSANKTVERTLIFENIYTEDRYSYDIGSFVGSEIPLRLSDGKSKVRGWFDTTNKVDISNLPIGQYIIYIKTKTDNIEDHGELNDIFLKNITSTTVVNGKHYSISINKNARFRLELTVREAS